MKRYAILNGSIVANTIVAMTDEDAQLVAPGCMDITDLNVGIGWVYDAETDTFNQPVEATE